MPGIAVADVLCYSLKTYKHDSTQTEHSWELCFSPTSSCTDQGGPERGGGDTVILHAGTLGGGGGVHTGFGGKDLWL